MNVDCCEDKLTRKIKEQNCIPIYPFNVHKCDFLCNKIKKYNFAAIKNEKMSNITVIIYVVHCSKLNSWIKFVY